MFQSAIDACHEHDKSRVGIARLRTISLVIWWGFAVVWTLAALELISMQTEEIMWSFCDLFAKLLLEAALFQGTMCTLEERKVVTLSLLSEQYHIEKYQFENLKR